ncbi:helix-turn-helix domain-containing transcriptional regulator [Helicobacter salomonis]|uniref:helix-turn-helix domain-containing transcriptional regulator n=1 Tax=Helicobacter salomonis TaxID=56878 RepID=UPI000CF194D7|nr:hypothetical protein [Helicobacter salomonis]
MVTFSNLDLSRYLNTEEKRLAYLNAVLEDGDEAQIKRALEDIARAQGRNLQSSQMDQAFPLLQVLRELGFALVVKASNSSSRTA